MEDFLFRHHIKDSVIAVGVSGGADSLAVALMAAQSLAVYGKKIVALTVDHGLRPTSANEAAYVAEIMRRNNIEHHILVWEGDKPKSGIEEAARIARYELLHKWCAEHGVSSLMVAHHILDQAETFLMRLQRGSGLKGLCCMREISVWRGLNILRPLLHTNPQVMENYLRQRHIEWVHDESNDDIQFLRSRIRNFWPEFVAQTGVDAEKLDGAIQRLQSSEDYIEAQINDIIQRQVTNDADVVFSFKHTDYLQWHAEVKFRVIASLCRREYIPRSDSVIGVVERLNHLPFNGVTLGDKEIFTAYNRVWIVPQLDAKHKSTSQDWKNFTELYPIYKGRKIPHKARLAVLKKGEMF
ncbi:MAG: tRNA lysidine(34) synthetase TilS [Alphaproteobacteria bacterium]|nr:tRNA lysidine(34) synthetase TilS [Alphaproteobacteria bacterium]